MKFVIMIVALLMLSCATSVDVGTREAKGKCPEAKGVMVNVSWGNGASTCTEGGEISVPFAEMLGALLGQLAAAVPGVSSPPPTVIVNGGTVSQPDE